MDRRIGLLGLGLLLVLAGCAKFAPRSPEFRHSHLLEPTTLPDVETVASSAPALQVVPVRAGANLDGTRLYYRRGDSKLSAYAQNTWASPPAEQLGRWLVTALERAGGVTQVVAPGGRGSSALRLESELLGLYHDVGVVPSEARIELRVQLVAQFGRQVLATRRFDIAVPVTSENPAGGVAATNLALARLLDEVAAFVRTEVQAAGDRS